jgi:hypothetical protein
VRRFDLSYGPYCYAAQYIRVMQYNVLIVCGMDFLMYFIGWMVGFGCASTPKLNNGTEMILFLK